MVEAVVYTTLRPPNWDVYLFEQPGAAPRRLTDHPALEYNAVFSPDGRWVCSPPSGPATPICVRSIRKAVANSCR